MVTQTDLLLADGRTLHAYDAVADGTQGQLAVFWHHGTPNVGAPPEPLLPAAASSGIRWVSYDRPGYGGSTPHPGRDLASAAAGAAELRAAVTGRAALEEYLASAGYDPELFTPADHAALAGEWSWLLTMVAQAMEGGLGGMVDDDLACVAPGGSTPHRCARRCCSCTAARIGWCPARTASGWPAGPLRRSCGCARTTGTSQS